MFKHDRGMLEVDGVKDCIDVLCRSVDSLRSSLARNSMESLRELFYQVPTASSVPEAKLN